MGMTRKVLQHPPNRVFAQRGAGFFVHELNLDGVNNGLVYIHSLSSDGESVSSGEFVWKM
jgi:hypothetical protein